MAFLKTWIIRLPVHTLMYDQRMLIEVAFSFRLVSSNIVFECLPLEKWRYAKHHA